MEAIFAIYSVTIVTNYLYAHFPTSSRIYAKTSVSRPTEVCCGELGEPSPLSSGWPSDSDSVWICPCT